MFSTMRGFLNRHKRKFIVAGVLVGGSSLALHYAQKKLREWQERETRNFLELARKKQHFESTERTCNQTILSVAPAICEAVMQALDTQQILNQLRAGAENKVELWDQMKVLTVARASALIYSFTMLVITLRIQLNIIGGYLYRDSTQADTAPLVSSDLQQKYLSLCHYFASEGVENLSRQIQAKVKTVVEPISLKEKLSLKDVEQLFWSIQAALCMDDADPLKKMSTYLIKDINMTDDQLLKNIMNETIDLLESDEVKTLSISCVSRSFAMLVDQIAEFFNPPSPVNSKQITEVSREQQGTSNGFTDKSQLNSFVSVSKMELPLAKLIPIINSLISQPLGHSLAGAPDAAVQQLILNDKLKLLGANVYESFSS